MKPWVLYFLVIAAMLALAVFWGLYQAALMLAILLLLPIALAGYCLLIKSGIEITVAEIQPVGNKRQEIPIEVTVTNKRLIPAARVDLLLCTDNAFAGGANASTIVTALPKKGTKRLEFSLRSEYCGKIKISFKELRIYDAFSLIHMKKKLNMELNTVVLPDINKIEDEMADSAGNHPDGDSFSPHKSGDDPSEIFNVRDFADGDRLKSVHWKLSMKQSRLMVKQYSSPIDDSITLLVDLCVERGDDYLRAVDALVGAAASLSDRLTEDSVPHRFCWYDGKRGELCTAKIERDSDMYEALGRVVSAGVYGGQPMGAASLVGAKATHLYLFTPTLPDSQRELLITLADKRSVIYIGEKSEEAYYAELCPISLAGNS